MAKTITKSTDPEIGHQLPSKTVLTVDIATDMKKKNFNSKQTATKQPETADSAPVVATWEDNLSSSSSSMPSGSSST